LPLAVWAGASYTINVKFVYRPFNNNFSRLAAALCFVLFGAQLPVRAQASDSYYGIKSQNLTVTETGSVADVRLEKPEILNPSVKQGSGDKAVGTLAIINAGLAAWNVISDGAPSAGVASSYASAIPAGMVQNWSAVANWKGPKEYIYSYTVTNLMGIDVIKVKYKVSFYYGGTAVRRTGEAELPGGGPGAKNGGTEAPGKDAALIPTGDYIANFTVTPLEMKVKWGWHFDLGVGMSHPMNIGTIASPVAWLQADLKWHVYTMLGPKGETGFWSYVVDGKGNFRDLSAEQKDLTKKIPAPAAPQQAPQLNWN